MLVLQIPSAATKAGRPMDKHVNKAKAKIDEKRAAKQ
jgi:hypothetical protein